MMWAGEIVIKCTCIFIFILFFSGGGGSLQITKNIKTVLQ